MLKTKFLISLVLAMAILVTQAGAVLAAPAAQEPASINGVVQSITLETDTSTGVTIVLVKVLDHDGSSQTARVSLETAMSLGLLTLNADGNPVIHNAALGRPIEISAATLIPDGGTKPHPIGAALAEFFSDVAGIDYDTIMAAHEDGTGFGVIAQALWLTTRLQGDSEVFLALLEARENNDYSAFVLEDGTTPKNWGQLRKVILEKKDNLGMVMSDKDNGNADENSGNGNGLENKPDKDKDKAKNNNGNGNGNG